MTPRARVIAFGAIIVVVTGGSTAYALGELGRSNDRQQRPPATSTVSLETVQRGPRIVFRHTGLDAEYGHVAEVSLTDPTGPRAFTKVSCDRVYARPTGASCLTTKRGVVTRYSALDLTAGWATRDTVALPGLPSRTRLSPDGSLVSSTVFVNGDSYLTTGFSTRTVIRRVGGTSAGDLEQFALVLDGRRVVPTDRNVWGVTFAADDRTFYATVATGGQTYLVKGDLRTRTLTSVADHVECPSLSPDGTRIAFKQARHSAARGSWWTPAVLDLATGKRTVLTTETHSVDDQIEWLDDDTLLYGLPRTTQTGVTDVWSLDVSPGATPRVLIPQAASPAVVR